MIKRKISQLGIYTVQEDIDKIPIINLQKIYLQKTSEIIYIVKNKKLEGIICLGDILYHTFNGETHINKEYAALTSFDVLKAHEIFRKKRNIHKIPVINEQGELVGDYSRWDDLLYIERSHMYLMKKEAVIKVLSSYVAVYLIEPLENDNPIFIQFIRYLNQFQIVYKILQKSQIGEKLTEKSICVFFTEDERRGMQCLYGVQLCQYDDYGCGRKPKADRKLRWVTYKSILQQILEFKLCDRLNLKISSHHTFRQVDDKASIFLRRLQQEGIKCFCFYVNEEKTTKYGMNFQKEINNKLKNDPVDNEKPWPKGEDNKIFYGSLSQLEDYKNEIAQQEIDHSCRMLEFKRNIKGKYFNAVNGRRCTCFQPEEYVGTIYLLGPCTILGLFTEDKHTIASFLQKKILEKGYAYRVENYGTMIRPDSQIDNRLQEIDTYNKNDIIIYLSRSGKAVNVPGNSLEKIYERNCVPSGWVTDEYMHCNYKANNVIADGMLEMIESCLAKGVNQDNYIGIHIDFHKVMRNYIKNKYLDQYFSVFPEMKYEKIGAIVMNCNPFSRGHYYLIEQARKQVDFLIVFVVESDESIFPFEERFWLVKKGTRGMSNVLVVPSGDFILSKNNFQEYFWKQEKESTACNAEYDIKIFAEYIARPLHITHRFAGEELEDHITKIYNEKMEKELPRMGITFVEIPRISNRREVVSASRIRAYMHDKKYDQAMELMPNITKQYLMQQLNIINTDQKREV